MKEISKNYTIKQIMPIEPGWYTWEENEPENDYEYSRVIGLYLIEITWENENKSKLIFPLTNHLSSNDLVELETWKENKDTKEIHPSNPLVYFPEETRDFFISKYFKE